MAQIADKVKWCLNKSNRGLVKVDIDLEKANNHIKKAEHNLKAAIFFSKNGFSDWAVNASFYSIYHCLLAILAKHGYESMNQECTIALVYNLIDKKDINMEFRWLDLISKHGSGDLEKDSVIKLREDFQYGTKTDVEEPKMRYLIDNSKEFIELVKEILKG